MVLQSKLLCIWSCAGVDVHPGTNAILDSVAKLLNESEHFIEQIKVGNFEILEEKSEDKAKPVGDGTIDEANAIMSAKEKNALKCILSQFDKKILEIIAEKDTRQSVRAAAKKQLEQAVTDAAKN